MARSIVDRHIDVTTAAAMLNVEPRRIQQLATEGRLIREAPGKYSMLSICDYLRSDEVDPLEARDLIGEQTRLTKAKADMAELKFEAERRRLIPSDEVEKAFFDIATVFRSKLKSLPTTLARRLEAKEPHEIKRLLQRALEDVLRDVSENPVDCTGE